MGGIYCLMGKSASGKDSLYRKLLEDKSLGLKALVTWTTRPIREGERDGVEYHFTDLEGLKRLREEGRVIEERVYHTVHGDWYYFTADDGQTDLAGESCLTILTPEAFVKLRAYYGAENVHPLYIEVEDGLRLSRALERERQQKEPKYKELCRRFLADSEDFSEEKLAEAGISRYFENNELERCLEELKRFIRSEHF